MSDVAPLGGKKEEDDGEPILETPLDYRPDLSLIGLIESEKGVVEDTYENRQILRQNKLNWDPVYSQNGAPTGLIAARSQEQTKERRVLSLAEKKPLLVDPRNNNSDYLTGLELIIDETACKMTPPWVIGATKKWIAEQDAGGPSSDRRAPAGLPHRCSVVKSDGIRCMLWSSGRIKDGGLCRVHLKSIRSPGEDVERARRKLMQSAPYAVDVLEELMENAISEPVRLKATTEILDRAGVRGGMDINMDVQVSDDRSPAAIVAERLDRLRQGAKNMEALLGEPAEIEDAVIVEDEDPSTSKPDSGLGVKTTEETTDDA